MSDSELKDMLYQKSDLTLEEKEIVDDRFEHFGKLKEKILLLNSKLTQLEGDNQ
jgi:hypothetical protein